MWPFTPTAPRFTGSWLRTLIGTSVVLKVSAFGYGSWCAYQWYATGVWPHTTLEVLLNWRPESDLPPFDMLWCRLFTIPLWMLLPIPGTVVGLLWGAICLVQASRVAHQRSVKNRSRTSPRRASGAL